MILLLAYCCYFQTCHALAISRLYKTHARLSKEEKRKVSSHNNKLVKRFHSWPPNNNKNQQDGGGCRWICAPHMTDPHTHTHTHIMGSVQYFHAHRFACICSGMHFTLHSLSMLQCVLLSRLLWLFPEKN